MGACNLLILWPPGAGSPQPTLPPSRTPRSPSSDNENPMNRILLPMLAMCLLVATAARPLRNRIPR
jgi:hypothetical protein